ncbi:phage major capsid protein [Streptomyces sp. NPDC054871]
MPLAYQQPGSTTFIPEIWDGELLVAFDPLLVWASPLVANNKYMGEIRTKGDVVHINSLLRPTVGDYTIADGMAAQRPETVDQELTITEANYIQVLVEDAERVQLAGALDSPINQQMIRSLARKADTFMGNIIANGATALAAIKPTAGSIPQSLYSTILDMMLALDDNDIPAGRYVVVSPRVKRYLIEHPSVANAAAYGEGGVTANGVVARLAGFTILTTTAMPTGVDIVAGHSEFATYASQFTGFRDGQSEKYRADYIDTLHLYGGKIVRYPELDTKKTDNTFDESKPTKGIVKATVEWVTAA